MKTQKKYFFRFGALAMALIMLALVMCGCGSKKVGKNYKSLTSNRTYTFKREKLNSGTFEMYDDGKAVGESGKRYNRTWTQEDDVLTMMSNGDVYGYYKVYKDCLVEIDDKDEEPDMYDYIAPKGKTFDWEYDGYEFSENGRVSYYSFYGSYGNAVGDYYVEDNIIYVKLRYTSSSIISQPEPEYKPLFYIYDGDHIAYAWQVIVKDRKF